MTKMLHLDADESVFFLKQLEFTKSQTYDVQYPELKARSLIPFSDEAGPGAETIRYEQYDSVGIAKIVTSYADDIPRADIKGKEFKGNVRSLATSYGYSIQDIRNAKMAGLPLEQRKANAAKKAILQKENSIAFFGDADHGLLGLINHPNISSTTIANDGAGTTTTLLTKTPAQINRDLNKITNYVVENTKEVEKPDTLALPTAQYNYIASTPRSDNSDTTILAYFLKNSPYIKNVVSIAELKNAGAMSADRMLVYNKNPEKLTMEVPQDFEQFDPQPKNLGYVVPCHSRTGGTIIYYPLSVAYVDGV